MTVNSVAMTREADAQRAFLAKVYGWMCFGLFITGIVAMGVASSRQLVMTIAINKPVFYGLIIGELALVFILTGLINRMSAATATLLFIAYSALSGVTLSFIFLVFTSESIAMTFFITAGTFGVSAIYGHLTKTDLTSIGNLCIMLLIGFIIATVVNLFLRSSAVYWITTYAGIFIFVGLTAYDAQKLKRMSPAEGTDSEVVRKGAIIGALALYLDFINLFLLLLRLFGRQR